jgi:hypothetical protein
MQPRAKAVSHLFMPGDTVGGIIKKYNLHDTTKEEMKVLLKSFMDINTNENPRAGSRKLIPILERHHDAVFKA